LSEEEEKKLYRLEKSLVANVDFDDQALNYLGFCTDIHYMLGHLGWMQFSNGVSANTHKEFALEILMTMAPILDEGVQSLSFRLEGIQQVVPYEYVCNDPTFRERKPDSLHLRDSPRERLSRAIPVSSGTNPYNTGIKEEIHNIIITTSEYNSSAQAGYKSNRTE
jgi:hypothetical protein